MAPTPLSAAAAQTIVDRIHLGDVQHPQTHIGYLHYCGRRNFAHGLVRASALCNTHTIGTCKSPTCIDKAEASARVHVSLAETVAHFAIDFAWKVLTEDAAVMAELRTIWKAATKSDVTLLCLSSHEPCHTAIIRQTLYDLATGFQETTTAQ